MKKIFYFFSAIIIFACNSESVTDCFQTEGNILQQEIEVATFDKILVNRDVELIIKEGADFEVIIETGENLMNDVEAIIVGDELRLTDNNSCNYVRDYGFTKIFVTAPNITEIRNSSQYEVSSDGVLNYDSLLLVSEDFNAPGTFTVGDFRMQVNTNSLSTVANNISSFYITGATQNLYVGFFSGAGRFEGENLIAEDVNIYHRGSNDITVNPQQSLTGELRGTGDLISINQPPMVDVEQYYSGQLIFN